MKSLGAIQAKQSWPLVQLGKVCADNICRLKQISDSHFDYIDISSIDRVHKRISSRMTFERSAAPSRAQQVVEEGDVLVSTVRPNLNAVGLVGKQRSRAQIASTGFCVLRAKSEVLPQYIYYFVQIPRCIKDLVSVSEKAAYPSVTDSEIKHLEIPLPPLSVQREIVARLERELAEADSLAANFKRIAELADAEFKAELDETFEKLSGETVSLGEICEIQRGGSPRPIQEFLTNADDGLNWIKIGDVAPDGKYIESVENKIIPEGLNKSRQVRAGDFLLSNSMSFGRPYILKIDGCIHDGWLVLHGFQSTFTEDFFYYLLRSSFVQAQFDSLARGASVRNLNTATVAIVKVQTTSREIQNDIVNSLDAVRNRCGQLKIAAEKGIRAAENLRAVILSEAFAQ